ncbi:MAG: hypothetical protein CVU73_14745 [Deltaproteobacteria bacterium HGW-Deltaproteobacteria-8]|jgi:hypothetical protein|nr:MAG: hypothetical protein CVU73_14745 [Deltaproteobacteria bacterium HGW-Deltaproteobacteria-8]
MPLPPLNTVVEGATIAERLWRLEQGFHTNRLEGQPVPAEDQALLRALFRAGCTSDEALAKFKALGK